MDGGNQGTQRRQLSGHDQRNQMRKHIQKVQDLFVKNVLAIRVEKNESEEIAVVVHRHGIACPVTLRCNAMGMLVGAFGKYRQVIHDARLATFPDFLKRPRLAQLSLIVSQRIRFATAMDKGLELIRLGIVDGHRYTVYKREALGKCGVPGVSAFQRAERDD